jgi:hypothetical protein
MTEMSKQTQSAQQRLFEQQVAQYVNESELPFSRPPPPPGQEVAVGQAPLNIEDA